MAYEPEEFRAGQVLSARALTALVAEVARLGRISVLAPMTLSDDDAGINLGVDLWTPTWIKLTGGGTGGDYAWTRQIAVNGGGWADHPGGRAGTAADDPAHELNGNEDVDLTPPPVVLAWRDPVSRTLLFQMGSC